MIEAVLVIILIFVIFLAFLFSFNLIILPFTKGVPYVPLKKKHLQAIFINFQFDSKLKIVDLGCGDGRVLRFLEKQGFKNLFGYEINLWPFTIGTIKNFFTRSNTKIYLKNFEKVNLGQFDIIFCYLLENYLVKLKNKFKTELKPDTKIISYGFQIPGWQPKQIIYTNKKNKNLGRVFVYKVK